MTSSDTPPKTSLFDNPTLSDVKIRQIYNGEVKEYFAHKAILSAQSEWFLEAFTGEFKEAHENTIDLHDDDPKLFEDMLRFCYTQKYDCSPPFSQSYGQAGLKKFCLCPLGLYALTDKYQMSTLRSQVLGELTKSLHGNIKPDQCKQLIHLYYSSCATPSSTIGHTLTTFIVRDQLWWFWDLSSSMELLEAYAPFGIDMFRALKEEGKICP